MKHVLVLLPMNERRRQKLESAGKDCTFIYSTPAEATEKMLRCANVILGNVKASMLPAAEKLEWLQLESAGTDAYVKPGVLRPGVILTNATGAYGKAVAEHGFALTLMLQKKLHLYRDKQRSAQWQDLGMVSSLSDCTVAVVGLGDIGQAYARMVKAMGAYVIGVKRRASDKPDCVDELAMTKDLDSVLPRADVVFSVLPNTAETRGIYTLERFDRMKDTAIFVNCGRGSAVSSETLYQALSEGKIQAAAVDVTEIEPLPADSPLWGLDNLVITPHISGGDHLPETYERIADIAAANLLAYCAGGELENVVDFATGYKL